MFEQLTQNKLASILELTLTELEPTIALRKSFVLTSRMILMITKEWIMYLSYQSTLGQFASFCRTLSMIYHNSYIYVQSHD